MATLTQTREAIVPGTIPKKPTSGEQFLKWAAVILPGVALYFIPASGMAANQRHLLAIFLATIIGLIVRPVAMGLVAFLGMSTVAITRAVPANAILSGFGNQTVWLIFCAFIFARAVTATQLGSRIAYLFIRRFGSSALSLGYSIAAADAVLAPFVPSDTARGGGIIYPIVRSVAKAFDSEPGPTAKRLGNYLVLVGFHTTYVASAMFLTGMAANIVIADFARKIAHVDLTWMRWMIGAAVPGLLTLFLVPYLLYALAPPIVRNTAPARELAGTELQKMGRTSRNERWLLAIMLTVMGGWITSPWHGASNTIVAFAGVSTILLAQVLRWEDMLSERKAWDALIWFGALIMMAEALQQQGVIGLLSDAAFRHIHGWAWMLAFLLLMVTYLYIHYGFASMTAHIMALYPGFLATALAVGVQPMLAAIALAYFSNLNAGITHYGTGSAPVYFGEGYVSLGEWWKLGFILSLVNLVVWLGLGMVWWKLLGWW